MSLFYGRLQAHACSVAETARHGLAVEEIPTRSSPVRPDPGRATGQQLSLLFVGNLTYRPNMEAAGRLVHEVLPAVRGRLDRTVRVRLVGPYHPSSRAWRAPRWR